jgi:excisionase family DNA binding protein
VNEHGTDETTETAVELIKTVMERPLSILEAASTLNVHPDTIRKAIVLGRLPATKPCGRYRIRRSDLNVWASAR